MKLFSEECKRNILRRNTYACEPGKEQTNYLLVGLLPAPTELLSDWKYVTDITDVSYLFDLIDLFMYIFCKSNEDSEKAATDSSTNYL